MPDLRDYDIILVNSSGGKDSQTMLRKVARLAAVQAVSDRITVVHADLGRVEWGGVRDLAEEQADHYGFRFEVISRPQGDLLDHIEQRGKFPSSAARYCTSDHKRGQVDKVMTKLVKELDLDRPARILNCLGFRAEESPARAKREEFIFDKRASTKTTRHVHTWLPIHHWTEDQVWRDIRASGVRYHEAYDAGMPRLSCCFCVLASKSALIRAAQIAPDLAEQYAQLEERIDHRFKNDLSMREIINQAEEATRKSLTVVPGNWAA